MQSFSGSSRIRPRHTASFAVFVWSRQAASKNVSVTISVGSTRHLGAPVFTVCPGSKSTACTIGDLPAGQTDELQAAVRVWSGARQGEQVRFSATAAAKAAVSGSSAATVTVSVPAQASPTPSFPTVGTGTTPTTGGVTLPAPVLPPATAAPTDPSGLFPTVSPGHSTSISAARATRGQAQQRSRRFRATTAAATLPLSSRLIGGQLVGLAILAGAIAMAITRLSLRTQRPQPDGKGKKG